MTMLLRVMRDRRGATAIEYGLIAAIISVSIMAIVFTLGDQLLALFEYASGKVAAHVP